MRKIVLATNNEGKIRELTQIFKEETNFQIIPQSSLNVPEIPETGLTFVENAIIKARHVAAKTGLPALADDSGLVVPYLNGKPGIHSARYAGENANSEDNINKLLADLKGVPDKHRQACFYCVLVYLSTPEDPIPLICEGKWSGVILTTPQGVEGFGYDPIFYVPTSKKTAAQLPVSLKNKISHRGIALQLLLKMLPEKI